MIQKNLLAGEKVRLTGLIKEDAPTLLKWREDTRFMRLWTSDPLIDRNLTRIIDWIEQIDNTEREITFAIRLQDQQDIIGIVVLDGIEWPNRVAGLGIGVGDPEHWGKGYGSEATRLIIDYAFDELNLYRLQLTVFEFNTRAIALYEKMGFQKEGIFREFMERENKRHDMLLYGLLRNEWQSLSSKDASKE